MKFWNELEGSTFFNKVFSKSIPIESIELFSITIDNDRPSITIEFDIPELPDKPPDKWKKSGFNTCRIGIHCGNIFNLEIKNIPTQEKLSITIENSQGTYFTTISNSNSLISFTTRYISLCGPSVYMNSRDTN